MRELTHATFSEHVGSRFRLQVGESESIELELIEATDHAAKDPNRDDRLRSAPFSLVFRGPLDIPLPQQVFKLEHDALSAIEIFLVPIGPDKEAIGLCYEAVFN